MSLRTIFLFASALTFAGVATAQHTHRTGESGHADHVNHVSHVKHNMLLQGTDEIFAYHLVYKAPHNYQVILRVELEEPVRQAYLAARQEHPEDTLVLLLDPLDISRIGELEEVSGTLLRRDAAGAPTTIVAGVRLPKDRFDLLYLDEVPLDLSK